MKLRIFMLLPFVGISAAAPLPVVSEDLQVQSAASMSIPRAAHQGTLLRSNEILITGGCSGPSCSPIELTAEIIHTATGKSSPTGRMHERRVSHMARHSQMDVC